MGKIVKYCNSCEEGFAEKFGFCPNCGSSLTAFEMNPLGGAGEVVAPVKTDSVNAEVETASSPAVVVPEIAATKQPEITPVPVHVAPAAEKSNVLIAETPVPETVAKSESADSFVKETRETKTFAASASNGSNGSNGNHQTNQNYVVSATNAANDGFHVTVIEEKNSKQRNMLLLGSLALMTTLAVGGTIYSLFNQNLLVGSIGDEGNLVAIMSAVEPPPEMETEPPPKKDDKDGGGGGGGGKEEPTPASKGRLVSQTKNPVTPPSVNIPQLTNPSIPLIQQTKGPEKVRPITNERAGLPNGLTGDILSNGQGRGGGIGSGTGAGIGGGRGDGEGNGIGSGSGNGRGNGAGDGTGDGTGRNAPPPPPAAKPKPPAVTTAMKIVSKPRANYTDTARQNQVQGTVTLRVTFLASGQIGSISPVSGLPYGLTEQAIAAARSIRFEPQMVNGAPVSVTKQVQYSFTIY
jgi:TonB family protein